MKRRFRVLSFILALLLLSCSLAGCASVSKPFNYFKRVLEKTVDKCFGGEVADLLLETLEHGSLTLGYGGTDLAEAPLESADLKLFFNAEEKGIVADGSFATGGKTYDTLIHLTGEEGVFASKAFLGSVNFGVNFSTLEKDLQNSIFRNDSNTAFARPEIGENAAKDAIRLKDSIFTVYTSLWEVLELSDDLADDFLAYLAEYAPHSRYTEKGTWYLSLTVENTALSRALRDTRAKAVKDKDLCRKLRELAGVKDTLASVKSGTAVSEWSDKVNDFLASDLRMEELCAKIDALPAFSLQLNAAVDRSASVLERVDITFAQEGKEGFRFLLDLSQKNVSVFTLTRGAATRTLTYRVEKSGLRIYQTALAYERTAEGEEPLHVSGGLRLDKKQDTFSLNLQKGEESRTFNGRFKEKLDGFELAVTDVSVNGEAHRFALSLAVKAEEKAPALPEYENLPKISEDRFKPISQRMTAAIGDIKAAWGDYEVDTDSVLTYFLQVLGIPEEIPTE